MKHSDTQPKFNLLNNDKSHLGDRDVYNFTHSIIRDLNNKDILEIGISGKYSSSYQLTAGSKSYQTIDLKTFDFINANSSSDPILNLELKEKVPLTVQAFDVIFINESFEHLSTLKIEIALEKIIKILRPGGLLVIRTPICSNTTDSEHKSSCPCNKHFISTLLKICLEHNFICAKADKRLFGFVRRSEIKHFAAPRRNKNIDRYISLLQKQKHHAEPNKEAGRLMIGCVTENNAKYQRQTLNLIKSIRWFGGNIAGADIFVCIVDEADDEFVRELKKWGAFVRIVKRFSEDHPQSNKLRFFELSEINYYDTIMFLDCDTIIVQDPLKYIDGKNFQAEMAAGATVPHELFKEIFYHYQLKVPERAYKTALSRISTIWYCNAGVLIFPKSILQQFFPVWKEYTEDLINNKHLLKDYFKFCEQASLTLSFVKNPVPFKKLPMKMNFPLVGRYLPEIQHCDPVIIHYHHRSDESGFIHEVTKSPYAQRRIKEFNQMLKKHGR
ncbi:methyltransferase domain-containing protein [Cytobacillus firmus]|uniref:methyltransferase domain-containing protein n=1 Tax=Cytobacillus firmus TaxID=1399 RepID=UPI0038516175